MIQVIDLPVDPSEYINCLLKEAQIDNLIITDEDFKRGTYYHQDKDRAENGKNEPRSMLVYAFQMHLQSSNHEGSGVFLRFPGLPALLFFSPELYLM